MNVDAINFNPWKHHAGFIKRRLGDIIDKDNLNDLNNSIKKIGSSIMDFYLGELSVDQIVKEVTFILRKNDITTRESFINYIDKMSGYKIIFITDGSGWVLRVSDDIQKYVHIHPAKNSIHSIRVRALTLKTAILVTTYSMLYNVPPLNIDNVNLVRKKYLNDPPIKLLNNKKGLGKMIELLTYTDSR